MIEQMDKIDIVKVGQVPLSTHLIHNLLHGCTRRKDLVTGKQLHFLMVTDGLDSMAILVDQLIRMFASCGSLMDASRLFCKVSKPSTYTWQAIINAHATLGQSNKALELYHKMRREGIRPGKFIYSCVLKACGCIGALGQGKVIHKEILISGLQSDVVIGNTLIDMYAKCGSLEEALKVFSDLLNRDTVSWNIMIAGYAHFGLGLPAIRFFDKMQQDGVCPDRVTCLCVLKACGSIGAIEEGKQIHRHINRLGFVSDLAVGSSLVDMYAKCGCLESAQKLFDELPTRSVVSWNGLIAGYSQHGHGFSGLRLFVRMQDEGIYPNTVTFLCILKACSSIGSIGLGKLLYDQVIKSGLDLDVAVGNALVDMYSKCGDLETAQKVFDKMPNRDVASWGTLISAYFEHSCPDSALIEFEKMQQEGIEPDRAAFLCSLKACGSTGAIGKGRLLHEQIIRTAMDSDVAVGNTLVDMYAKGGSLEETCKVFDKLQNRDVVSCNAMIAGYAQHGHSLDTLEILKAMQHNGIKPDKVTFLCTLKACGILGAKEQGKLIHDQIIRLGSESDINFGTTLISMYAKCGGLEEARNVFDRLPSRNLVSWSAMIAGYAQHGNCCLAAQSLEDVQQQGLKPDNKIYSGLLMACSHAGQLIEGHDYFEAMSKRLGITPTTEHYNCMVDLLSRTGQLKEAKMLLQTMPISPDIMGWMSLLTACRTYGNLDLGRQCFDQVVQLDPIITGGYVLMSNIYTDVQMLEDVYKIQERQIYADAWRKPGTAWIEIKSEVHEFTVGDRTHLQSDWIYKKLRKLRNSIQDDGYVPEVNLVLGAM